MGTKAPPKSSGTSGKSKKAPAKSRQRVAGLVASLVVVGGTAVWLGWAAPTPPSGSGEGIAGTARDAAASLVRVVRGHRLGVLAGALALVGLGAVVRKKAYLLTLNAIAAVVLAACAALLYPGTNAVLRDTMEGIPEAGREIIGGR